MPLSASLTYAAIVALRFQESCAVYLMALVIFLDRTILLWPCVCDEKQEKGRTALGFHKETRSPERKWNLSGSLSDFCSPLSVPGHKWIAQVRHLFRAEQCEVQLNRQLCLFHIQFSKEFCLSLVMVPVQISIHRTWWTPSAWALPLGTAALCTRVSRVPGAHRTIVAV